MKVFTNYLSAILLMSVLLIGCKDDKEVVPKSTISYDGSDYDLSNAVLLDYGRYPPHEGSYQELFLSSPDVVIREKAGKIDSVYGTGHAIFFRLFTAGIGELAEGEYTFDFSNGPFESGSFVYSYAVFNANFVLRNQVAHVMIAGTVTVKKEKTDYRITFDCVEDTGKHINGFFKGPLKVYDEK
ncbi:hypothetical protein [Dyadobacter sp. CY323]|uniref:hypothetical protein n=1 Tax=Dyadobacter sp. CY323 TaxID=2907302 RepID=UPI001F3A48BC|nr:hypothetical protein [Dyadobacter sp. CY323]MCE6990358.1 hypothetical protein [Dyadobacter sp. CY323]